MFWSLIAKAFFGVLLVNVIAYLFLKHNFSIDNIENSSIDLTIRVNTFRRPDLLEIFVQHYTKCNNVQQIQVVWSDQSNSPPFNWVDHYKENQLVFEVHKDDSLSNRFIPLIEIPTQAVFSTDDDIIVPCDVLRESLLVWKSNERALVGFSPRMHALDLYSGTLRYLRWQHTWWSGIYSIVLTKACFLHRDYFSDFTQSVSSEVLQYIDSQRNCEDLAMAQLVALRSKAAPVWVQGRIFEIGGSGGGISSGASHFLDRGNCLSFLHNHPPLPRSSPSYDPLSTHPSHLWVTGYQKYLSMDPPLTLPLSLPLPFPLSFTSTSYYDLFRLWSYPI